MEKIESSWGNVSFHAPLLMPAAIMEKYGTVQAGDLLSESIVKQSPVSDDDLVKTANKVSSPRPFLHIQEVSCVV